MMVLNGDCWNIQLETLLADPFEPPHARPACGNACPLCFENIDSTGILSFLADTLINNSSESLPWKF